MGAPAGGRPVVVGTAGHIDHGKTTLVRALTGIDTDRLPEERDRGITIDLGFAHLDAGGRRLGIVDVPGHERFVRTMVAGAGGIDVVMLVVAADEGVMPQTREHLDICRLLGVPRGIVVMTKCDLVDDEWLALVEDDVRRAVAGTCLAGATPVRFGAPRDGPVHGAADVVAALLAVADGPADDREHRPVRLPVDRVFTMKGFGTVVTGTLLTGRLAVGEPVEVLPAGRPTRVRGLHVHGEAVEEARAGRRTAVNVQGLSQGEIERGDVVAAAGELGGVNVLDAIVAWLPHSPHPLRHRRRLLLHVGTTHARALVVLSDRAELAPGDLAVAQVRLDRPVVALPGDRFILRGFAAASGHGRTLGGGTVLSIAGPRRRRGVAADWEGPVALVAPRRDRSTEVGWALREAGGRGLDRAGLRRLTGSSSATLDAAVRRLLETGEAVRYDRERDAVVHVVALEALERRALARLDAFHRERPRAAAMPGEELRAGLDPRLFHLLVRRLEAAGAIEAGRDGVRRAGAAPRDDAALDALKARALDACVAAGLTPPRGKELADLLGATPPDLDAALAELAAAGLLVRVKDDIHVAPAALAALRARLVAHLERSGRIGTAEFKDMVGGSRKYAIPLAEFFDRERVTLRVGDERVLRDRKTGG